MSRVTSVLLSSSARDVACAARVNDWLDARGLTLLRPAWRLPACCGGDRPMAAPLHVGAINHLPAQELLSHVASLPWTRPESVQVALHDGAGDAWRLLDPFAPERSRELEPARPFRSPGPVGDTTLLLGFDSLEDWGKVAAAVDGFLAAHDLPGLAPAWDLAECHGDGKRMETPLYAGAFVRLPLDGLLKFLRTLPWEEPTCVQVMLRGGGEERWRLVEPVRRGWSRLF